MKIVTLSTYPFDTPRHGGQHRLANIVAAYKRARHTVVSVGVLGADHYAPSPGFLPYPAPGILGAYLDNTFLMEDWAIGRWAASDDGGYAMLAARLPAGVDVLHVEQPWLFEFALRFAAQGPRRIRVVYGSQNIEYRLKQEIVASYLGATHAQACAERVQACELAALGAADLVCAVSQGDVDWSRQHTRAPVVLAPNGVAMRTCTPEDLTAANKLTGHRKYALYCASAHPPNVVGFYDMFGAGIGCLAPNERLVVAGSAGQAILSATVARKTAGLTRHLATSGEISEGALSALLQLAHAMVLPITHGGGTNLKTAEALWSGHHVVATSVAMRGFEPFAASRGVTVADDPVQFRTALRLAMAEPPLELTPTERDARRVVLWESCLRPLVNHVNELAR